RELRGFIVAETRPDSHAGRARSRVYLNQRPNAVVLRLIDKVGISKRRIFESREHGSQVGGLRAPWERRPGYRHVGSLSRQATAPGHGLGRLQKEGLCSLFATGFCRYSLPMGKGGGCLRFVRSNSWILLKRRRVMARPASI